MQEEFEKFLQERGVNEHVALFIPEYAEYKEQTVSILIYVLCFMRGMLKEDNRNTSSGLRTSKILLSSR